MRNPEIDIGCSLSLSVQRLEENILRELLLQRSHVMDMFDEESGGRTDIPGWFFKETIQIGLA